MARELSSCIGVLEPLQTAVSLEGQVQELNSVLRERGDPPITMVGWSWGAWLAFMVAAEHPGVPEKLILVGSGPFEEKYAGDITRTRLDRLTEEERAEALSLMQTMGEAATPDKDAAMARLGRLISRADSYDPLPHDDDVLECQYDVHRKVWERADELRRSGRLLKLGEKIQCPVVAIHGDYDPHPFEGVREPLSRTLKDFRFVLLAKCGHAPWIERAARDDFFRSLRSELPKYPVP